MISPKLLRPLLLLLPALIAAPASAQWSPASGQWGKVVQTDLRVMTWNVQDGLCSTNTKTEGQNNWTALARIVAAFQPDVLLLQECADNSGNGTGNNADSVSTMTTVMERFLNGGNDPWNGGSVSAYVAKYAPGYSLPYIYVTSNTDNFNRNVIASRYPFTDLNGDGKATLSDIPNISSTAYAPGGDGGLRGFQFVEIDLPDATYLGDVVVGNAHLKAGSGSSNHDQRVEAAQNVAYYVDYGLNGGGSGVPDPNSRIADSPQMTNILGPDTPVVLGGDWNEDEGSNGTKGPAEWLTRAQQTGGTDGTDRDRSDSALDGATDAFTGSGNSLGNVKFDYIAWQDSIATLRIQTIFNSASTSGSSVPPELVGFPNVTAASSIASDHRPVIVDLVLPVGGGCVAPSSYCISAGNSFSPSGANMAWAGSQSVAANSLTLLAQSAAGNQFGIFYYGSNQVQQAFGDGFRCVGGGASGIFRFGPAVLTDTWGDVSYAVDLTQSPAGAGAGQITPGSTWNFQFWYRDPQAGGAGFNLSNGLSFPFCP
jgi:endonuclease/exonuclease/phosphatase family metal-dependent hydrolase